MDRSNTTIFAFVAALLGALAVAAPVAIRSSSPTPVQSSAALVSASPRVSESRKRPFQILIDFLGITSDDAYKDWGGTPDPRSEYSIKFFIATVPEPLAPSFRNKFDTYLDAIQRAAEDSGYLLDRFDLPWGDPNKTESTLFRLGEEIDLDWEPSLEGERQVFASLRPNNKDQTDPQNQPGILLFRRKAASDHTLLMVFVIGETPTWGIRKVAFATALDWIAWLSNLWDQGNYPKRFPKSTDAGALNIRIMGPSFSGSAESLRLALGGWLASHPLTAEPHTTILSGTATAIDVTSGESPLGAGSFHATTIDLHDRQELTNKYLLDLGTRLDRIAILSEAGTSFGSAERVNRKERDLPLVLKFPLHISSLRSALRNAAPAAAPQFELGRRNLSFSEEQSTAGGYVVPAFSPRATSYDELTLNKLLESIRQRRMDYVQIAATDVEDLIFLAQQIRRSCPDTVLVTSTADLRFLHSEVNSDLRGMLVFSTYPLFPPNQSWTYPFLGQAGLTQFPSDNAEGVYNAVLILLGDDNKMLEYGSPFDQTSPKPPLWVSIVGNDSLWPIAVMPVPDKGEYLYSECRKVPLKITLSQALYPRPFLVGFLLISLFCAGASSLVVKELPSLRLPMVPLIRSGLNWLFRAIPQSISILNGEAVFETNRATRRLTLLQYTTILLVLNAIVFLFFLIPFLPESGLSTLVVSWHSSRLVKVLGLIVAGLLLMESLAVGTAFWQTWTTASSIAEYLSAFVILLAGLGSLVSVTMLIRPTMSESGSSYGLFLLSRSVNLGSGVSPLMPILLVGGAGLLLLVCSTRRIGLLEERPIPSPFLNFTGSSFEGVPELEDRVRYLLQCPSRELPGSRLIIPLLLGALWVALRRGRPSYPIDGKCFDWALRISAFLVYSAFTLVLLRFVAVWIHLQNLLQRLYWHPTRAAYANLRESLPGDISERKRVYLAEPRPSYTATEASLSCAREILGKTNFPYLLTAVAAAERCLYRSYQAELSDSSSALIRSREKTARALALVSGAITLIFDAEWRTRQIRRQLSKGDRRIVDRLTDQANLFVATRVVDLLRQVVPHLQNLATFGTASMLLMLFAMSSYPFPQRDTFLWLSWITLLGALLALLIVFVQMSRDRIVSLLSGTIPGKLSWDANLVNQVVLFGVVPILSLLGAQFPEVFRDLFSWATRMGGGH
jgi:hypothetical protein